MARGVRRGRNPSVPIAVLLRFPLVFSIDEKPSRNGMKWQSPRFTEKITPTIVKYFGLVRYWVTLASGYDLVLNTGVLRYYRGLGPVT